MAVSGKRRDLAGTGQGLRQLGKAQPPARRIWLDVVVLSGKQRKRLHWADLAQSGRRASSTAAIRQGHGFQVSRMPFGARSL